MFVKGVNCYESSSSANTSTKQIQWDGFMTMYVSVPVNVNTAQTFVMANTVEYQICIS
jgi:hypothetical protein